MATRKVISSQLLLVTANELKQIPVVHTTVSTKGTTRMGRKKIVLLGLVAIVLLRDPAVDLWSRFVLSPPPFSFYYFESLPETGSRGKNGIFVSSRAMAAKQYLEARYPVGTDALAAVHEIEQAGARCGRMKGTRELFDCSYSIYKVYLQPFSSIGWSVQFYVDDGKSLITSVGVGRFITGL